MHNPYILKVKVNSKRPDFRVFASYFFGDDLYNYDSDGNSVTVTSREWTELYMRSRSNPDLHFEIYPIQENPLVIGVSSQKEENVYRIAYFLAKETNGKVINENNEALPLESLKEKMGDFNLAERLLLADKSIWREATEENPYPNLNKS